MPIVVEKNPLFLQGSTQRQYETYKMVLLAGLTCKSAPANLTLSSVDQEHINAEIFHIPNCLNSTAHERGKLMS